MVVSKILIAVERNSNAYKSVKVGIDLAQSFKEAEVMLIHVIEPALAIGNPDAGILPEQALFRLQQEGEEFIKELIKPYQNLVNISFLLLEGKVIEEVRQMTKNYSADILIIGLHHQRGFASLFGDNLTKEIVLKVHCPVLLTHNLT